MGDTGIGHASTAMALTKRLHQLKQSTVLVTKAKQPRSRMTGKCHVRFCNRVRRGDPPDLGSATPQHLWAECKVSLNACVMRYWNRKKAVLDSIVLVTTEPRLTGPWIVRHYEERPEIEQDYEQMQSGGWQLQKLSSTRSSEIVFSVLTVVLSYSLYPLFANTQTGARFADTTRQALAFEQLRSRRTPIIAYAGGYFDIFETLGFVRFVLQLPAAVQERLRYWLDEHLHAVIQRE
jgi:hypothetical protein